MEKGVIALISYFIGLSHAHSLGEVSIRHLPCVTLSKYAQPRDFWQRLGRCTATSTPVSHHRTTQTSELECRRWKVLRLITSRDQLEIDTLRAFIVRDRLEDSYYLTTEAISMVFKFLHSIHHPQPRRICSIAVKYHTCIRTVPESYIG